MPKSLFPAAVVIRMMRDGPAGLRTDATRAASFTGVDPELAEVVRLELWSEYRRWLETFVVPELQKLVPEARDRVVLAAPDWSADQVESFRKAWQADCGGAASLLVNPEIVPLSGAEALGETDFAGRMLPALISALEEAQSMLDPEKYEPEARARIAGVLQACSEADVASRHAAAAPWLA